MNQAITQKLRPPSAADRSAIALSTLCLIHCLALPILISLLPWLSWLETHESMVHRWLLAFIAPLSLWALSRGCAHHGRWPVLFGGLLAVAALVGAIALEPLVPAMELPLTVIGSAILISSHIYNLRALSRCRMGTDAHA